MLLKIMSDENVADDDSRKAYRLYSGVKQVEFHRQGYSADGSGWTGATAAVLMDDGESYNFPVSGNAYVMNDAGKTISSFGASPPR